MEITEAACVSDELCRLKEEEEEIVRLGDSRVKRVRDNIAILKEDEEDGEFSSL